MPPREPSPAQSSENNDEKAEQKSGSRTLTTSERKVRIIKLLTPLFLERGYENVSMNEIIAAVGGSKATIYSLFGNKSGLFEEVVRQMTKEVTIALDVRSPGTIEEQLTRMGRSFLQNVLTSQILEFHRLMVAMGKTFPGAASAFYESGPMQTYRIVGDWVAEQQELGRLRDGDPRQMAVLFLDMLIGEYQLGRLTGKLPNPDPDEMDEKLHAAVEMFVRGWATDK